MTMSRKHLIPSLLPGVLLLTAISVSGQSMHADRSHAVAAASKTQVKTTPGAHPQNDGERVFQQNCSRCHTAPDGFSPRISGTIVRHMRVRASLSQQDEEELLRFFNP